jgi:hypothetical protein
MSSPRSCRVLRGPDQAGVMGWQGPMPIQRPPPVKVISAGRRGLAVGPEVIKQVHERIVSIAQCQGLWKVGGCASTPRW